MAKFRKKPVVVEAVQWFPHKGANEVCTGDMLDATPPCSIAGPHIHICGEGGIELVYPGEWVITSPDGSKRTCKPDIFEATYEPVDG